MTPTKPNRNGTNGRFRHIPTLNAYVLVNRTKDDVYFLRLTRRREQPVPARFERTLVESHDVDVVKWVASEVIKWPKTTAGATLQRALTAQEGRAKIVAVLQAALQRL